MNAYKVKAGIGVIAGKTVRSMPERYITTLTFIAVHDLCANMHNSV